MTFNIVLLPGDGIGPEVIAAARGVLDTVAKRFDLSFAYLEKLIGGAAIDATGDPLPKETLDACLASDAVLLGAVGGPKWDGGKRRPEEGLLGLRKGLGLFANLRPVKVTDATLDRSPLKADIVRGVDMLIVRELTGGLYFGAKHRDANSASDQCIYTVAEIERVTRVAFDAARGRNRRVTSVDKANVIETSGLWRETVTRIARDFPDVALDHMLVDTAAMRLVQNPRHFDVLLTENMFGDILSDEASMLPGSIGLLGSASLGAAGPGVYEPIHGSAPDIAGRDAANPVGTILAAAMMLRYSLKQPEAADAIEAAVARTLATHEPTADLGGRAACSSFTLSVVGCCATPRVAEGRFSTARGACKS